MIFGHLGKQSFVTITRVILFIWFSASFSDIAAATTVNAFWVDRSGHRITIDGKRVDQPPKDKEQFPKGRATADLQKSTTITLIERRKRKAKRREAKRREARQRIYRIKKNLGWGTWMTGLFGLFMIIFAFKKVLFGGSKKGENAMESPYIRGGGWG